MNNATTKPKKKELYDIRNPFYKTGDGIEEVKTVVAKQTVFKQSDTELINLVKRLAEAHNALHAHLKTNYRWD